MIAVAISMSADLVFYAIEDGTVMQMRKEDDRVAVHVWPNAITARYNSFEDLVNYLADLTPLEGDMAKPASSIAETIRWFLPENTTGSLEIETLDNPTIEDLDLFAAHFAPAPFAPKPASRPTASA